MFSTNPTTAVAKSPVAVRSPVSSAATIARPPASANWLDEWNDPVIATATAVGALVLSEQHGGVLGEIGQPAELDSAYQGDLSELIVGSMHWLARRQHADGGWCSSSADPAATSKLMTSMMVRSAFRLTGAPAAYPELGERMSSFIKRQGGVEQLKAQYGPLRSATLLTCGTSALAEVVDWKQLPAIPIERANFDAASSRVEFWLNRDPVLPAIVALGVASFLLNKPMNPLTHWRRSRAARRAIAWLAERQRDDGSFDHSVPVTSLVLMSLSSVGQTTGPIVRRGVEYLFAEVRCDGSWV
ncbi:hypothetical protein N9N28_14770 [Rubripirellula amarantea]|nr:hypothetical protein [Rubripirellula amarantea]